MQLGSLCGRPLVDGIWGWIDGWIHDVLLDFSLRRVAAFEICEAEQLQFSYVEPFAVLPSTRHGLALDADPKRWELIERDMDWASVRNLADVTVVSPNGDWSCVVMDADCDPETWRLTGLRVQRRWWEWFARRMIDVDQVITGGANMLVVQSAPFIGSLPDRPR